MTILQVKNLWKRYDGQAKAALRGISFRVAAGETLAIVGESGSSKTTLLKLVAGLEEPGGGAVLFNGEPVMSPSQQLVPGHRKIRLVFQDSRLFPNISVRENIAYELRKQPQATQTKRISELIRLCNLQTIQRRLPKQLSGGEQQRAAIARALANQPELLLLDEPFSNVDTPFKRNFREQLSVISRETGITVIIVTHEASEALALADRIAVLQAGRLVQTGVPQEIYEQPVSPYVANLFGYANIFRWKDLKPALRNMPETFADLSPKDRLCLRPEAIQISTVQKSVFTGKVAQVRYMGSHVEAKVFVTTGLHLLLHAPVSLIRVGQILPLQIDWKKVWVFER